MTQNSLQISEGAKKGRKEPQELTLIVNYKYRALLCNVSK